MDTVRAFAMGAENRSKPLRVFDWDKAADLIKEKKPLRAVAGLQEDMEWTSGEIYLDGKPVLDEYTYLSSTWATPILDLDGEDVECWVYEEDSEWNSGTKWPESALAILGAEAK